MTDQPEAAASRVELGKEYDRAWNIIRFNSELAFARQKLSLHEFRQIINAVAAAFVDSSGDVMRGALKAFVVDHETNLYSDAMDHAVTSFCNVRYGIIKNAERAGEKLDGEKVIRRAIAAATASLYEDAITNAKRALSTTTPAPDRATGCDEPAAFIDSAAGMRGALEEARPYVDDAVSNCSWCYEQDGCEHCKGALALRDRIDLALSSPTPVAASEHSCPLCDPNYLRVRPGQ